MAVPVANPVMNLVNVKDSRWLTLEVCREFQRNKCTRTETECKFAHPPPHVEVQNGRVTCCFDSIKGKCQRKDPPCKYLHPPQHLKEQLLQNGRNNLILKNLQMQAMAAGSFPVVPQMVPVGGLQQISDNSLYARTQGLNPSPYGPGISPAGVPNAFSQYIVPGVLPSCAPGIPAVDTPPTSISGAATVGVPQNMGGGPNSKITRPDRLESTNSSNGSEQGWTYADSLAQSQYSNLYFQQGMTVPGMVPYVKRPAMADGKSGVPMYQPGTGTTAYQQAALAAMQMQQQSFVPAVTIAGPHPGMPRF